MAVTAPLWGFMCDRMGTKKIMMIVLAGNTIVYAGMAMSTNVAHIILFPGVQGVSGGLSTVMFALIAFITPVKELKKISKLPDGCDDIGRSHRPWNGGLLASIIGYRLTFSASSLLFMGIIPIAFMIRMPPP
jgi:DHA1 family tetracycline resistance protein-like MFS transporter